MVVVVFGLSLKEKLQTLTLSPLLGGLLLAEPLEAWTLVDLHLPPPPPETAPSH